MSFEAPRAVSLAEQKRLERLQSGLHGRVRTILREHQAPIVERPVRGMPMTIAGRIILDARGAGLLELPALVQLESTEPNTSALYVSRLSGWLGQPISAFRNFGVSILKPPGKYHALKADLQPLPQDSQLFGLTDVWEPLDGLERGMPTPSQLPDVQHFAHFCLKQLEAVPEEGPKTRPAHYPLPIPKGS